MKKYAKRQIKHNQKYLLFHSLGVLARPPSEMLSWLKSPLLVMLQFVDPNLLSGDFGAPLQEGETRETPLRHLTDMASPSDYSTHENQLILAKQLIELGGSASAVSIPYGETPLHNICLSAVVTNLDFAELILEAGAGPNTTPRTIWDRHR
jgi:hypothetical protein